jgi:hypothetical protein
MQIRQGELGAGRAEFTVRSICAKSGYCAEAAQADVVDRGVEAGEQFLGRSLVLRYNQDGRNAGTVKLEKPAADQSRGPVFWKHDRREGYRLFLFS